MKPIDRLLNILTVLLLGLTAISCLCIGSIFVNPLGLFNFLGPATFPAPLTVPTLPAAAATATEVVFPTFPPEWTATVTPTATEALPAGTPTEGEGVAPVAGTKTPFPTPVGPTATPTDPEPPTSTPTLPRPTATRTDGPYPGQAPSPTVAPPTPYP